MKKYFKYLYSLSRDKDVTNEYLHEEIVSHWYPFQTEENIHALLDYFGV